jgi:hypothetical protein
MDKVKKKKTTRSIDEVTYRSSEYFILQHLYYSMGSNRMKWYEYKELIIPSLKKVILLALNKQRLGTLPIKECKYNWHDIDEVIREIKERYQIFGNYEGSDMVFDSFIIAFGGK